MDQIEKKLCLGTAQFGLKYGIANQRGQIPAQEVNRILEKCLEEKITTLDTSPIYGESQKIIGRFKDISDFRIVTKIPRFHSQDASFYKKADEILFNSLRDVRVDSFYACLVHQFNFYLENPKIWDWLVRVKKKGMVKNIGFSLYSPEELDLLLKNGIHPDMVQLPYSVLDQRFERRFPELDALNIQVFARSVFLQGAVFLNQKEIKNRFGEAEGTFAALNRIAEENNVPVEALCLGFVLSQPYIEKVVLGVDSVHQLDRNICFCRFPAHSLVIRDELRNMAVDDENIVLPTRWK